MYPELSKFGYKSSSACTKLLNDQQDPTSLFYNRGYVQNVNVRFELFLTQFSNSWNTISFTLIKLVWVFYLTPPNMLVSLVTMICFTTSMLLKREVQLYQLYCSVNMTFLTGSWWFLPSCDILSRMDPWKGLSWSAKQNQQEGLWVRRLVCRTSWSHWKRYFQGSAYIPADLLRLGLWTKYQVGPLYTLFHSAINCSKCLVRFVWFLT